MPRSDLARADDVYVIYRVECGHPIMANADRGSIDRVVASLRGWQTRLATDDDLVSLVTPGRRCECMTKACDVVAAWQQHAWFCGGRAAAGE